MRDTRVEEVEHISDSDSDEADPNMEKSNPEPTLGIFPNHVHQDPTYLIFPNKTDQDKWLYQLTLLFIVCFKLACMISDNGCKN